MSTYSHKSTHYWLKVLLLLFTFTYIVVEVTKKGVPIASDLSLHINFKSLPFLIFFCIMAVVNWCLEILKWKTTVSSTYSLSFQNALKQSLASLTSSLITPNRIGEYGAKAIFFPSKKRNKILFLNFVHNGSQMLITLVFGLPALLFLIYSYALKINGKMALVLGSCIVILIVIGSVYRKKQLGIKGLSMENLWQQFVNISLSVKFKLLLFSVLRYCTFSILFYLLLNFFGSGASFIQVFPFICAMYLMVSLLPTFLLVDVVVKGGIAIWLFSFIGVAEFTVLATVFSMWILNTVLPALVGSYFVITIKTKHQNASH